MNKLEAASTSSEILVDMRSDVIVGVSVDTIAAILFVCLTAATVVSINMKSAMVLFFPPAQQWYHSVC